MPEQKSKSKKYAKYVSNLPPCNNACPAGENVQGWLTLVKQQKLQQAWEEIVKNNPFPAIHGRVCYHFCEAKCNRSHYDKSVSIHCVERYLGDTALAQNWKINVPPLSGKKVLIVGAGPGGLSAAYHLRLLGHDVTIYEAMPNAGGMMFSGIPSYRLPREILAGEIRRIIDMGVKIEFNRKVDDVLAEKAKGNFDAVFIAIGAHIGKKAAFPIENPCPVIDAISYLRDFSFGRQKNYGSKLVVYGGGNTAMDVARTARRLGINDVTVVYHRTRQKMPARNFEIEYAIAEGVKLQFLRSITRLDGNTLTLSINELDAEGAPKATGKIETLETDAVVLALSQTPDMDFLRKVPGLEFSANGLIKVDKYFMSGYPGIFAGGDVIHLERCVTIAVGHGKHAARRIDTYLRSQEFAAHVKHDPATYENLHIIDEKSKALQEIEVTAENRVKSFVEICATCTKDEVENETKRCFSCGNCFYCDGCFEVCPVNAITKRETELGYNINIDRCIGCGKCVRRCPCGAVMLFDRN